MSRLTSVGGSTQRFVLEDGTEGWLEVKKDPTDKQAEKGTPIAVVFVPDFQEPAPELDEPGHEVTAGHPDYPAEQAEKQLKRDEVREKAEKAADRRQAAADKRAHPEEKDDKPAAKPSAKEAVEAHKASPKPVTQKHEYPKPSTGSGRPEPFRPSTSG